MNDYVTVVSVDIQPTVALSSDQSEKDTKSMFVTVLSINNNQNTTTINTSENSNEGEIVTVYRLPGERLGFGLKFQGGTKTNEKVQRLYIQSCDLESPASKARASWGLLGEGDEILQIDSEPVSNMTRIECVKRLKDRNIAINLLVKKRDLNSNSTNKNELNTNAPKKRPLPPPPPIVPPRKIIKKPPPRESNPLQIVQKNLATEISTPVAAETYLNTLDDDEINRNDESDETGSTISSQISVISNFSSESDLSLMSSIASNNDLTKILTKPFQMIEREFNINSSNVLTTDTPISMSIDNLLMFNDLEPTIEIEDDKVKIDIKPSNTYVNVDINGTNEEQRQYENIDIKLPPIPRPRSISLPQDNGEIDEKSPVKNIESWLNDAKTLNGSPSNDENHASSEDPKRDYDAIKFECFAAGDNEDDEKLGPPELLNISEAYFNFSWCSSNSSKNLPTIGEAEEELSSLEPSGQSLIKIKEPIFIVHAVLDSESDNEEKSEFNKGDSCLISECVDMEINNNSFYLHEREDKSDNNDKRMQGENKIIQSVKTEKNSFVPENLAVISMKEIIEIEAKGASEKMTRKENREADQSKNNDVTSSPGDAIKIPDQHDNKSSGNETITNDSEKLESKCGDELDKVGITFEKPLINEPVNEIQETNETNRENKDMTSLPTRPVYIFSHDADMKQKPNQISSECFPIPIGDIVTNKMSDSDNIKTNKTKSSMMIATTTKATAIVAPLVPRKTYHFEESKNIVGTKFPNKSATLGYRSIHWRNKDEKSEKSVKDKIAMFSSSTSNISYTLPMKHSKHKTSTSAMHRNGSIARSSDNIFSSSDVLKSRVNGKKSMSVENLDDYKDVDDESEIQLNYTPVNKPLVMSSTPLTLNIGKYQSVESLIEPRNNHMIQSKLPLTAPALSRRISFSGYSNSEIKENRQKSMANIVENRKKSMSKLRGLVIPEKVPENEMQLNEKVLGLPVIRSKECDLINGRNVFNKNASVSQSNDIASVKSFTTRKSEIQGLVKAVPRKLIDDTKYDSQVNKLPPVKPPRTSLIISSNKSNTTDESDTESCLSSRISTPPISPVAKKPLTRTFSSETNTSISSSSTLTSGSGSQASRSSCSSTHGPRANKSTVTVSVRKSVLASSKSRSGRECLEKSWRDEDSTDGGIDNDDRKRVPKAKARSSLINYKVVSANEKFVDKIINVATYNEVVSSDSDEKMEPSESFTSSPIVKHIPSGSKKEAAQSKIMSEMAKWVQTEATKSNEVFKKDVEVRLTPKVLEPPKKLSLSEIRRNFENKSVDIETSPAPKTPKEKSTSHNRFSSWDSVASSSSGVSSELLGTGTGTNNLESLQTLQSDFGSFSSFGSSHSLITPQDLQLIIDEADPPLEMPEAFVVVLQRETAESSIGVTLAGGSDYEAKEITIHKILTNSPADKDGRLKRGDRLLSINGLSMRGLTHRESLSVLKSPRADVVMVVTRSKSVIKTNSLTKTNRGSLGSLPSLIEKNDFQLEGSFNIKSQDSKKNDKEIASDIQSIKIIKDGAGLGFSIDGGYDSPSGNKPLIIKKIFMGGAAERSSNLKVGDEVMEINGRSIGKQTRIDVWNMIKNLPQGNPVELTIKRN